MSYGYQPVGHSPLGGSRPTSGLGVASLVIGIASFLVLPFFGGILALTMGHVALSQLRGVRGSGRGPALAGTILGYLNVALVLLVVVGGAIILPILVDQQRVAADGAVRADVRATVTAIINAQAERESTVSATLSDGDAHMVLAFDYNLYRADGEGDLLPVPAPGSLYSLCAFDRDAKLYREAGYGFSSGTGKFGTVDDCAALYASGPR